MRRTVTSALLGGALAAGVAATAAPALAVDPPQNDLFENSAIFPAEGAVYVGTNVGAVDEAGEPSHAHSEYGPLHSIWYEWTAVDDGETTISTCGSSFNTRLGVYTGTSVSALTEVAFNEDGNDPTCSDPKFAVVTFEATVGTTYQIAVDTSGGIPDDISGDPRGDVRIELVAPEGDDPPPPPPPDDDTNPGTEAAEEPYTFRMLRLKPLCAEAGSKSTEDCPRDATNLRFYSAEENQTWANRQDSVRRWVDKLNSRGADINLVTVPKPSGVMDGAVLKYLRSQGKGGEILSQNVTPGKKITTTTSRPLLLKVSFFDPAEDQKILDATLAALVKAGKDRKEVKSPCAFIDSNASPDMIERKLAESLGSGTLTQKRAGEILRSFGCNYEVTYPDGPECDKFLPKSCTGYVDAPGLATDTVLDVLGVTRVRKDKNGVVLARDIIHLKVGLPVRQDLAFVISENVGTGAVTDSSPQLRDLGLGLDGKLTSSSDQVNQMTVQVIERTTGRLVSNAQVEFYDSTGAPATRTTDSSGATTFFSLLPRPGRYTLKASFTGANGAKEVGFRSIDAIDRHGSSFVTMSGRTVSWDGSSYSGTTQGLADARARVFVPGNLGTGLTGEPAAAPRIRQIQAAVPSGGAFLTGQHNAVYLPNDTNFMVTTKAGLLAIGSGYDGQSAQKRGVTPRRLLSVADALNLVFTILKGIEEMNASGEGTVSQLLSTEEKKDVTTGTQAMEQQGAHKVFTGTPSHSFAGVIATGGGNLIGQAGGNVISTGGLNLIGQAGGNFSTAKLISDKGLGRMTPRRSTSGGILMGNPNVISLEKDMMPVYGGKDIALE